MYVYAEIVTGIVTNVISALVKWLWSLKSTTKTSSGIFPNSDLPIFRIFMVVDVVMRECFFGCYFGN